MSIGLTMCVSFVGYQYLRDGSHYFYFQWYYYESNTPQIGVPSWWFLMAIPPEVVYFIILSKVYFTNFFSFFKEKVGPQPLQPPPWAISLLHNGFSIPLSHNTLNNLKIVVYLGFIIEFSICLSFVQLLIE